MFVYCVTNAKYMQNNPLMMRGGIIETLLVTGDMARKSAMLFEVRFWFILRTHTHTHRDKGMQPSLGSLMPGLALIAHEQCKKKTPLHTHTHTVTFPSLSRT